MSQQCYFRFKCVCHTCRYFLSNLFFFNKTQFNRNQCAFQVSQTMLGYPKNVVQKIDVYYSKVCMLKEYKYFTRSFCFLTLLEAQRSFQLRSVYSRKCWDLQTMLCCECPIICVISENVGMSQACYIRFCVCVTLVGISRVVCAFSTKKSNNNKSVFTVFVSNVGISPRMHFI